MDDITQTDETSGPGSAALTGAGDEAPARRWSRTRVAGGVGLLLFAAAAAGLATGIWEIDYRSAYFASHAARCQNNLKQMGLVYKMYANESAGELWPTLSAENGRLMFIREEAYPEYLTEEDILVCPGPKRDVPEDLIDDLFYVYTGYVLTSDEDVVAFAEGYNARLAGGGDFSTDLEVGDDTIPRLREGIERFYITDINNPAASAIVQSNIPVMWDWPDNHQQGWGANVLYMDGHVEWQAYPGEFPMTEVAFTTLATLAGYTPPDAWNVPYYAYPPTPEISSCYNNFGKLGIMHKMYANESQGEKWPQLSSESGKLMFEAADVIPEFVDDREFLVCPGRADAPPLPIFGDDHYIYWGYLLVEESDALAFADAYAGHLAAGGDFADDLDVPSSYGDSLHRLREGIERFVITDINSPAGFIAAQSDIPVMMEWPDNHEGHPGGTVLYMDGHREWHDYPGEFPMTEAVINAFRALAQPAPPDPYAEPMTLYLPENDPYDFLADCRLNLTQLSLVNRMYANESFGQVSPPLAIVPGRLMFDEASMYPNYMSNRELLVCPGPVFEAAGSLVDDQHYAYTGYVLLNDSDVQQFVTAYTATLAGGGDFTGDLPFPTSYGDTLLRLKEQVERDFTWPPDTPLEEIPTPQDVPLFIEWPGNHEGRTGGHVVYLDRHVEWHDYPGEFPMTEATITTLAALADWSPATAWESRPFTDEDDPYQQALCGRNLYSMGLSFKTFANVAAGELYPPLSPTAGTLVFDDARFSEFHLFDLRRLNCPGSPSAYRQPAEEDHSYVYLGYVVPDQETLEQFASGYQQQVGAGGDFTEDLEIGEETVPRIREGIERFLITDINSPAVLAHAQHEIPLLIEWPDNHGDIRGGNVLYMDGHAEWLDYPGEFPMTEEAMAVLTQLAGRGPIRPPAPPRERSRLDALLLQNGGD